MPGLVHDFRVFIASPGGLDDERKAFKEILQEYNELDPQGRRVMFTPIGWEITLGGHGRPQERINKDLIECDYFVLVLWDRWGSPPDVDGRFTSGCEEEFSLALTCLEDPNRPMQEVVVFFKEVDSKRKLDPGEQLKKVLNFRTELERSKKHLFMTFAEISSFQASLRKFLFRWDHDHTARPTEHLEILRQGVVAWNKWRDENREVIPHLTGANLRGSYLSEVNLSGADLTRVDLSNADLIGANLSKANLTEANLTLTNLYGANLTDANLRGTLLIETHLSEANLSHATLGRTIFANVDLRTAIGLDTVLHDHPSEIGINTLYRSKALIPEVFLRGTVMPSSMIAYARSLVAAEQPIDYYSCFISYSSQDEVLAERLYADLQAKGVRSWLAPHDLMIGSPIIHSIDEAIRLHDKVVLLLSEAAVMSPWVEYEFNLATAREATEGRTVLYPLRLDDTVLTTQQAWAATLREGRHIGDFRGWKDHDAYQAAFARLLRDLKAEPR